MASPSDLVTLDQVKAWLGQNAPSNEDKVLGMLITQMSRTVLSYINRSSVLPKSFNMTANGTGKTAMMLREYPVHEITSLIIDGQTISAAVGGGNGYLLEACDDEPPGGPQTLHLRGHVFRAGIQNISVTYAMGYRASDETAVAGAAVSVQQPFGYWVSDMSVKNGLTGALLVKVAGTPDAGQYALDPKLPGNYVFSDADAGQSMLISYGYVPADLAEAVLEWIAERYSYRGRVGQNSKALNGQETVSFSITDIPKFVMLSLQQFCRVSTF